MTLSESFPYHTKIWAVTLEMTADKVGIMLLGEAAAAIGKRHEPGYTSLRKVCNIMRQENFEREGYNKYNEMFQR